MATTNRYGIQWQAIGTGGGCEAWQHGATDGTHIIATDANYGLGFATIYGYCGHDDCEGVEIADSGDFEDVSSLDYVTHARLRAWMRRADGQCARCASDNGTGR